MSTSLVDSVSIEACVEAGRTSIIKMYELLAVNYGVAIEMK